MAGRDNIFCVLWLYCQPNPHLYLFNACRSTGRGFATSLQINFQSHGVCQLEAVMFPLPTNGGESRWRGGGRAEEGLPVTSLNDCQQFFDVWFMTMMVATSVIPESGGGVSLAGSYTFVTLAQPFRYLKGLPIHMTSFAPITVLWNRSNIVSLLLVKKSETNKKKFGNFSLYRVTVSK